MQEKLRTLRQTLYNACILHIENILNVIETHVKMWENEK